MPKDYSELFRKPGAAAPGAAAPALAAPAPAAPAPDVTSPASNPFEKYFRRPEKGTVATRPVQEQAVTTGERALLQTVAPHDPREKAAWLHKKGYQAQALPSGQVAVKKKDGSGWGVIDEHGPSWMDLVDAADEVLFGVGAGLGGAATATAGPIGLLHSAKGAALGGATVEAGRQALGAMAGFERTPQEVLTDVAVSGAMAGVAEPVFRGAGRALGAAGRKIFRGKAKPEPPRPEGFIGRGDRAREASLEPAQEAAAPRAGVVPQTVDEIVDPMEAATRDLEAVVRGERPAGYTDEQFIELQQIAAARVKHGETAGRPGETIAATTEPPAPAPDVAPPGRQGRPMAEPLRELQERPGALQRLSQGDMPDELPLFPQKPKPYLDRLAAETGESPGSILAEVDPEAYKAIHGLGRKPVGGLPEPEPRGHLDPEARLQPVEPPAAGGKDPAMWEWAKDAAKQTRPHAPPRWREGPGGRPESMPEAEMAEKLYGALKDTREPRDAYTKLQDIGISNDDAAGILVDPPPPKAPRAPGPQQYGETPKFQPTSRTLAEIRTEPGGKLKPEPPPLRGGVGGSLGQSFPGVPEDLGPAAWKSFNDLLADGIDPRQAQQMTSLRWGSRLLEEPPPPPPPQLPRGGGPAPKRRGLVTPTEELGPSGANVVDLGAGRTAVRWRGQDIGGFGDPKLAGDFAHYLNSIVREDALLFGKGPPAQARLAAGIEDTLRKAGYGEADIRGFNQWLKEELERAIMEGGTRVKLQPKQYAVKGHEGTRREGYEWAMTLDGEDLGGDFDGPAGVKAAKEIQDILEEILQADERTAGHAQQYQVGQRYRSMQRKIGEILDESNHYEDEVHDFLDNLDKKFGTGFDVDSYWDDAADAYKVESEGIHLGLYESGGDADDVAEAAKNLIREYRTAEAADFEIDKLKSMMEYSDDLEAYQIDDAIKELDDYVKPLPEGYWKDAAKHRAGPGEIMGGPRAKLEIQADGSIWIDDFYVTGAQIGQSPAAQAALGKVLSVVETILQRRTWTGRQFDELYDVMVAAGVDPTDAVKTAAELQKYLKRRYPQPIRGGVGEPAERLTAEEAKGLTPLDPKQVDEFIAGAKGEQVLVTFKKKDGTVRTMDVAERPPQLEIEGPGKGRRQGSITELAKDLSDKELLEMVQESGTPKAPKPIGEKYGTTNPAELPREGLIEWLFESQPAVVTGRGAKRKTPAVWERKGPYATGTKKGEGRPMAIRGTREEGAYRAPGEILQVEAGGKRLRSSGTDAAPEMEPAFKPSLKRTTVTGGRLPKKGPRKPKPRKEAGPELGPPKPREVPEMRPPPKALPEPEPEWVEEPRWEVDPKQWELEPELPEPKGGPPPGERPHPDDWTPEGRLPPPQPPFEPPRPPRGARDAMKDAAKVYSMTTKPGQARFLWRLAVNLAEKYTPEFYRSASEAVKKALASISRILKTRGMEAAHAAAYSLIQQNREFRTWLEKQTGSSTRTPTPASAGR